MGVWYCTREDVRNALDIKASAYNDAELDSVIESGSRTIDGDVLGAGCLHRRFYPEVATRYFPWPHLPNSTSRYRIWLDASELISLTSITTAGTAIPLASVFLEPVNAGPPYTHVELDRASAAAFVGGSTAQRNVAMTGTWGFRADEAPAGALAEALDDTETAVDVTNSAALGVGSILRCESERMIVTDRAMLDTGQNTSTLTASAADVAVTVASGAALNAREVIQIDSERMEIRAIVGNVLTVRRAYDGTVLAAHTSGTDIYAGRTLTVTRGALGTTATTHLTGIALQRHVVPGPVNELAIAESLDHLLGRLSGWARTVGEGEGAQEYGARGLARLRRATYQSHGRKGRLRRI